MYLSNLKGHAIPNFKDYTETGENFGENFYYFLFYAIYLKSPFGFLSSRLAHSSSEKSRNKTQITKICDT